MKQKQFRSIATYLIIGLTMIFCVEMIFVLRTGGDATPISPGNEEVPASSSKPAEVRPYGVSSSNRLATEAGMKILSEGGNSVDAAVAVAFALAVVEPYGSGLGGGGGMLLYDSTSKTSSFLNYKEVVPYSKYNKDNNIGIPGFVKGMEAALKKYGTMSLEKVMEPAINYASQGFYVEADLNYRLRSAQYDMPVENLPQFYPHGEAIAEGEKLIQSELANTLKEIQKNGSKTFYEGALTGEIAKASRISLEDIKSYEIKEQKPVKGTYGDYTVISAPPPFSGITLMQFLKLSEKLKLPNPKEQQTSFIEKLIAIKNVTYKDRMNTIGDPSIYNLDYDSLVQEEHIAKLYNDLSTGAEVDLQEEEHESTTHFVVIDKAGTIVSCTNTLSNFFGSRVYVKGFFLNNTLSTLNNNENSLNCYAPGKTPRSYTCPTVITDNSKLLLGIGSAGGERIPQVVTQVLLGYFKYGEDINFSINSPRVVIDKTTINSEEKLSQEAINALSDEGYNSVVKKENFYYGAVQCLILEMKANKIYGGADNRRHGVYKTSN